MSKNTLRIRLKINRERIQLGNTEVLSNLIDIVGGMAELATMLNIHLSTVQGWNTRGRISKGGAKLIAEHGVLGEYYKVKDLRLDLADKGS